MQAPPPSLRTIAAALSIAAAAAPAAVPACAAASQATAAPATFQGTGRIVDVDVRERLLTIEHDDMPDLGMPAMTMDFPVAAAVDLAALAAGQRVRFALAVQDGTLTVTALQPAPGPRP